MNMLVGDSGLHIGRCSESFLSATQPGDICRSFYICPVVVYPPLDIKVLFYCLLIVFRPRMSRSCYIAYSSCFDHGYQGSGRVGGAHDVCAHLRCYWSHHSTLRYVAGNGLCCRWLSACFAKLKLLYMRIVV